MAPLTHSADGAYRVYAHSMAALWRDLLTPLGADDNVLFIGHSGELEAALVACFPDAALAGHMRGSSTS